ncbi:lysine--tRNA ligase [Halorhodospira halochloris]|uniref:lysine--tRNA ligase n=1 Tax=Halorhodospira halochloris TaxID=1052 RepID=UPI001EE81539|nr:lysine--tRNA ligase [Halorhodospira halochloris]MCG5530911.1 lysine--tRNA ligase [Halorhodospira halochloris]
MTDSQQNPSADENKLIAQRRSKLGELRERGIAFPNDFRRDSLAGKLHEAYGEYDAEHLKQTGVRVTVAGRMMTQRVMGKASFAHIKDMSGQIQLYVRRDDLPEGLYKDFKGWDLGDIVGASGLLFRTQKGELSIHCDDIRLLTKSLRPLPEKWHGLTDAETRYRQRYVDLMVNDTSRQVFILRTRIVAALRRYLDGQGFMEVETPMMHPIPGGAAARPFITHHNALGRDLYLRIAPELYLKRLIVGGFESVYEINRNFRNEGVSTRHNPEFTMLELYQAYADHRDLMALTERLLRHLALEVVGSSTISWQGQDIDFAASFERLTLSEAILRYNPQLGVEDLKDRERAAAAAQACGIEVKPTDGLGRIITNLFEETAEGNLVGPAFVTDYPKEVSPLARPRDDDPFFTERFELIVAGREIANGFAELNDPEDQAERFKAQAAELAAGDHEAMHYDADYIRALEYGMPPTAGEGIGIDRLAMLLCGCESIRDVIMFPAMRPEGRSAGDC